jgi:hypothetical protein
MGGGGINVGQYVTYFVILKKSWAQIEEMLPEII